MRPMGTMRPMRTMRSGIEEMVAWIAGLEALSWTHEAWDTMNWCSAGQPGFQGEGIGHWTHAGVYWSRTVKRQHG